MPQTFKKAYHYLNMKVKKDDEKKHIIIIKFEVKIAQNNVSMPNYALCAMLCCIVGLPNSLCLAS